MTILKRPDSLREDLAKVAPELPNVKGDPNLRLIQNHKTKSFEQRKAEYDQARLRILGSTEPEIASIGNANDAEATTPTPETRPSLVLYTPNPPPYNGKAKCVICKYDIEGHELGIPARPQYKCSTCPECFLCQDCQEDLIKYQDTDEDWHYEDMLPHTRKHSVYKTEVPDSMTPSVLHTSHPPHGMDLEWFEWYRDLCE